MREAPIFSTTPARAGLRRTLRDRRRAVSGLQRRRAAAALAARIAASRIYRASCDIALYWPADGEIDVLPLAQHAWVQGKRTYLPVLEAPHRRLRFARFEAHTRLRPNRYGIAEPCNRGRLRLPSTLDLAIAPLVAFDPRGNRIGMGGGYYDRSFAFLGGHARWRRPGLLGAAFDFQRVPAIAAATWDVALLAVATDRCWYPRTPR